MKDELDAIAKEFLAKLNELEKQNGAKVEITRYFHGEKNPPLRMKIEYDLKIAEAVDEEEVLID